MSRAGPPGFSPHPHHKKTKNVWLPGNAVVRDEDEAAQSAAPAAAAEAPLAAADEGRARVLTVEVAGGDEEAKAPIEPVPAASPSQAQRPLQQPADGEFAGDSEVQGAMSAPRRSHTLSHSRALSGRGVARADARARAARGGPGQELAQAGVAQRVAAAAAAASAPVAAAAAAAAVAVCVASQGEATAAAQRQAVADER
jgi:hypothetical protein